MTDKLIEESLWDTSKHIDAKEGKLDPADIEWIQHLMLEAADELNQCRADNEALRAEKAGMGQSYAGALIDIDRAGKFIIKLFGAIEDVLSARDFQRLRNRLPQVIRAEDIEEFLKAVGNAIERGPEAPGQGG